MLLSDLVRQDRRWQDPRSQDERWQEQRRQRGRRLPPVQLDPAGMNNGTLTGALASGLARGLQAYWRQDEQALDELALDEMAMDRAADGAIAEAARNAARPAGPTPLLPAADARAAGIPAPSARPPRGWNGFAATLGQAEAANPALAGRLAPLRRQAGAMGAGTSLGPARGPMRGETITEDDLRATMQRHGLSRAQVLARLAAEGRL